MKSMFLLFKPLLLFIALLVTAASSFALCVDAEQANLRSKPSSKAEVVWTVGRFMPLRGIKQEGSWIQVIDLEGAKAWIHDSLVSDSIDCAVVKVSKAQLRKGPGAKHPPTPLSFAHKYMPFKKLDRDGAWLYLEDDYGYRHWVIENNLWEPLAYAQLNY